MGSYYHDQFPLESACRVFVILLLIFTIIQFTCSSLFFTYSLRIAEQAHALPSSSGQFLVLRHLGRVSQVDRPGLDLNRPRRREGFVWSL